MATDNTQQIDEILTWLENAVERDVVHRQLGSSQPRGRSPKVIHAEAKQAILDWHNKQILEMMKDEQYDDERSLSMFKYVWRNKLKGSK